MIEIYGSRIWLAIGISHVALRFNISARTLKVVRSFLRIVVARGRYVDGNRVEGTTLEGAPVWPLDARFYVSLTAPEYIQEAYTWEHRLRASPSLKEETPLYRNNYRSHALYGIAHRAGNKVIKVSGLSRSRRKIEKVKIFQPTWSIYRIVCRFYF